MIAVDPNSLTPQRSHLSVKKYIKNLAETIVKGGKITSPIEVNPQGAIINGHHRVAVAKLLQQTVNVIIIG